jgi:hypothetical protein
MSKWYYMLQKRAVSIYPYIVIREAPSAKQKAIVIGKIIITAFQDSVI